MSTSHTADHGHGHGHGAGGDHVPHVLPMKVYLATWGTLLVLTVVTVTASYLDLGHTGNLIVALAIATIKASVVGLIFMHLFWDHKFHSIIFLFSVLFLAIFIGFTMFDTQFRGEAETIENQRPVDIKQPFEAQQTGDVAVPKPAATGAGATAPASTATPAPPASPASPTH
jgi:cytochrome c oxidase subunit 4